MKLELGELVQWTEGGKHYTGRKVLFGGEPLEPGRFATVNVIKHSYTGELHTVSIFDMKPYPSSPIPEPTK